MKPDDPLLRILACPLDKGPLHLLPAAADAEGHEEALYNPRLRRRYPIVDGIPQLLPSSGEQVSGEEHERLLARVSGGRTPTDPAGRPWAPGATP
ncbi:Trm112 family protein [Streptomyces sp. KMM 9044]|uniref:Trm112 family protein n=1 Tax=Streptomyces sp. KMM 9044 TaxID=2744474 RepID=UPI002150D414|nr:Trm112 family protein [Streptomyces sp. KMM 9044]WAX80236.1 Trm112 family protein [Streptomyces sp. KMM 9044]